MADTATAQTRKKPKSGPVTAPVATGVTDPDHAVWWAVAVCALATLILAYPALAGGFLVTTRSDQYLGAYAVRVFGTHVWVTTGQIPQWNPYIFGGMPYLASQNGDVFYPTALLRVFLRGDIAVTWAFIIHEFLAGWFTYLFLRAVGLSFYGAIVGALAYMLGGPFASYVSPGHDGKMYVSALFPLTGMVALYAVRGGRAWAYPALAFLVGLGILTPHPQLMQYSLLGVGAIALYGVFWEKDPDERVEPRVAFQRIGLLVVAVVVGLLIGGIYYAPGLAYVPYSPRAHGALPGYATPYDFSASWSMPPEEIINTYLPEFTGLLDNYFGRNRIHLHSEYIGAAVYALAGAGVFGALSSTSKRRAVWFWLTVIVIGFLWSLGGYTPFYHLIYWLVPGTKYFRAPAAFFFIPAFGIAVLAGMGVDAIITRRVSATYAYIAAGVAAFIAVLAVSGGLVTFGGTIAPQGLYDMVVANAAQVTFGAIRALVAVLIIGVLIVLAQRQRIDPVIAACVMAVVVSVELWSVERLYWGFSPPASKIFAPDSALTLVKAEPQPARLLAAQLAEGGVAPGDAEMDYDLPMINGVRLVLGHHGNEIRRYDELLDHDNNYRQVLSPQMWRLLNIRFLLTNIDSLPVPGSQKVVGPEKDAAGSTLYLYRLPGDNPAAWVTPVAVKAPDDQTLATVRDPRFDPLRAAIFDTAAKVPAVAGVKALPDPLPESVTVTHFEPGHMTYKLSAPAPANATLIASENYYPGWSATVDGKPMPTGRADYTLIGVPLTAGATTVDLVFHDPALPNGERVTFAALLVSAIWLALTLVRRHPPEMAG